jgi:hypothetical protein
MLVSDRPTKILHGYRAAFDPSEMKAGGYMVGAEPPMHVHCHCGKRFDPSPRQSKIAGTAVGQERATP